jgi:hypothetical protein
VIISNKSRQQTLLTVAQLLLKSLEPQQCLYLLLLQCIVFHLVASLTNKSLLIFIGNNTQGHAKRQEYLEINLKFLLKSETTKRDSIILPEDECVLITFVLLRDYAYSWFSVPVSPEGM